MSNDNILKRIWYVFNGIYVVTLFYSVFVNYTEGDTNGLFMCIVAVLTLVMVPLIFKVFHFKPIYEIYLIATVFAYIASVWGSTLGGYGLPGFDKFLHFSSGFLMLTVAVMLYYLLSSNNEIKTKQEKRVFYVFINAVNMAIALCWEFFEYAMLIFFNNDAINHYTQGVHDSMTDMLCATIAGLLLTIWIMKSRSNFFMNTAQKFYELNVKKKP